MIAAFSLIADTLGFRRFSVSSIDYRLANESRKGERRSTRTATLDGGSVLYDTGFTVAEKDITVAVDASPANVEWIEYMTQIYSQIGVALPDGAYLAHPKSYRINGSRIEWRLLILGTI